MAMEKRTLEILIIEDNFTDMRYCRDLIKGMLQEAKIFCAGSSQEGLDILAKQKIDLLLIDVVLPDVSGFKLATIIRSKPQYRFIKIVFITGKQADQLRVFKYFHCYDFLTKPYTAAEFRRRMQPLFEGLQLQHEAPAKEKMVVLRTKTEIFLVEYKTICYAESTGRKIHVVTNNQTYKQIDIGLNQFIQEVNHAKFRKCHKSFAVNTDNIKEIVKTSGRTWEIHFDENGQISCPLSRTYQKDISSVLA